MNSNKTKAPEDGILNSMDRLTHNFKQFFLADRIRNLPIVVVGVAFIGGFSLSAYLTDRLLIEPRILRVQQLEEELSGFQKNQSSDEKTESNYLPLRAEMDSIGIRTWTTPSGEFSIRLLHIVPATQGFAARVQWNASPAPPDYLHEGEIYLLHIEDVAYRLNIERVDRERMAFALYQ